MPEAQPPVTSAVRSDSNGSGRRETFGRESGRVGRPAHNRGVRDSIFQVHANTVQWNQEALHDASGGVLYVLPLDFGSQILYAVEIGLDDLVPLLESHFVHCAVARDSGIVDQYFNRAHIALDVINRGLTGLVVANIELVGLNPAISGKFLRRFFITGGWDDVLREDLRSLFLGGGYSFR